MRQSTDPASDQSEAKTRHNTSLDLLRKGRAFTIFAIIYPLVVLYISPASKAAIGAFYTIFGAFHKTEYVAEFLVLYLIAFVPGGLFALFMPNGKEGAAQRIAANIPLTLVYMLVAPLCITPTAWLLRLLTFRVLS